MGSEWPISGVPRVKYMFAAGVLFRDSFVLAEISTKTLLGLNDGAEEEFVRFIPENFTCRIYRLFGIESSLVAFGCR